MTVTPAAPASCPECGGPQLPDDPRGWLTFQHVDQCGLGTAERDQEIWDRDALRTGLTWVPPDPADPGDDGTRRVNRRGWERPATDAERALLTSLGHTVHDGLTTVVAALTWSMHARTWPDLEPGGGYPSSTPTGHSPA